MLTATDRAQLEAKGISEAQINQQLKDFQTGFPFLRLAVATASWLLTMQLRSST